jgi:hypothetical protein
MLSAIYPQLLAQSPACFCWATGLDANDLDQIDNTAPVIHLILFAGKDLDLDRHGRVGFLYWYRVRVSDVVGHKTPYHGSSKDLPRIETWWEEREDSCQPNEQSVRSRIVEHEVISLLPS